MFEMPTQPQNAVKVLLSGVKFWGAHWKQFCFLTLLALIVATIPALIYPELNKVDVIALIKFIEAYWSYILIFSILMFFIFAFIVHRTYYLMYDKKTSTFSSLLLVLRKMPALILALIINYVVVMLGLLLFFIPGIGLMVLLSMYFVLIIVENLGPISAFKESWQLVTEQWFHTFLVLFIMLLVIGVLSILISIGTIDIWVIAHPAGEGVFHIGNRILRIASGTIFYGLFVSTLLMLLHDLKLRFKLNSSSQEK